MSTALDNRPRRVWLYSWLLPGLIFWVPLLISMYFAFTSRQHTVTDSYSDVVLHAFAFTFLTVSLSSSYFRRGALYWPAGWMLIYATFIECVQYFLPSRSFELGDIAVDVAGIAVGLILFYVIINPLLNKLQRRDRKSSDRKSSDRKSSDRKSSDRKSSDRKISDRKSSD